jgi:very-short-patch-repair endonuclease
MRKLDFARQLRNLQTDCEQRLWSYLRARRLFGLKFRRQQPIGSYVVDFFCAEKRLIVGLDGGQHQDRAGYDGARDAWLKSEGYTVLRYWNNEVLVNFEGVLEDIGRVAGVIAVATPTPQTLSPQGRGAETSLDECEHADNPQTGLSPLPLEGGGAGGEGGALP